MKTLKRLCRQHSHIHNLGENGTLAIPGNNSGDFEELDNEVNSMMLKSQNRSANGHQFADICKVCGKEGHRRSCHPLQPL